MRIFTEDERYQKIIEKLEKKVSKIFSLPKKSYVELNFVSREEIKEINGRTRENDAVTDVLSFPNLEDIFEKKINIKDYKFDLDPELGMLNLGQIVMCEDKIFEQAKEYGTGEKREFCYLLTHGVLHILGYDHIDEEDKDAMRKMEEKILEEF